MKLFQTYLHLLIFLSFSATSTAIPKYAKTGCNDTCGNVMIPYPFGIGADCSVNKWYIVDCNSSTPYLPALNHLEVLGVNLKNLTVTVSSPRITDCQNSVWNNNGVDLGGSPFLFSKRHNKFVFEGCGIAVMMDNGSVVTGCSTACPGVTVSERNSCFGIGCCQAAIPHYLKSYNVNFTMEEEEEGGCGPAFLVDEALYDQGRNTSFIPVSLRWTLANSDHLTCCDNATRKRRKVDMSNGTSVDTWECKYFTGYTGNPYLVDGCKYDYGM
ncbi:putative wall-associated receptor kinase [Helianthus annuus]|nr:putative wall-associated receptor kinase [Helianthus annuus]